MSGIVGLLHLDGSPVDRQLLDRMTSFLAFRGPDAVRTRVDGSVGFGHTLLCTAEESANERQPLARNGHWIVADARIDAREELVAELTAKGCAVSLSVPDAELILHAYHVWGEECIGHLLGDFSFALWDASRRRLFCARDRFGLKPFFYSHCGNIFLFSNTLRCLRLHPSVPDELDELAIADFLLFGFNWEVEATAFSAIRRLPPAHVLTVSPEGVCLRRYWTLPVEDQLRYRDPVDYVDQFRHLISGAVKDRLRTSSVGVLMSGGLDSSTAAAFARSSLAAHSSPFDLRGYTCVFDDLLPDRERHFAGVAARALEMPIHFLVVDDYELFGDWKEVERRPPEPITEPFLGVSRDQLQQVARKHRVVLTGQGGDPVFSTSVTSYAARLLRTGQYASLLSAFFRFLTAEGRLSRLYLRTRLRLLAESRRPPAALPSWLNTDFSRRLGLEERWRTYHSQSPPDGVLRPTAFQALQSPMWASTFESYDPALTLVPVECRHPFFDLRLIRFLLRVPPVPWCTDKELVRQAVRGLLPQEIRLRRKTPLARDPAPLLLRRSAARWWQNAPLAPRLAHWVDWEKIPCLTGNETSEGVWMHLGPRSMNLWLLGLDSTEPIPAQHVLTLDNP